MSSALMATTVPYKPDVVMTWVPTAMSRRNRASVSAERTRARRANSISSATTHTNATASTT